MLKVKPFKNNSNIKGKNLFDFIIIIFIIIIITINFYILVIITINFYILETQNLTEKINKIEGALTDS